MTSHPSSPAELELASVSIAYKMSRFSGRLTVSPGTVVFQPEGRWANHMNVEPPVRIVHRDRQLTVITGRLILPCVNSGVVLVDEDPTSRFTGLVLLPSWSRQALVRAAEAAGFEVTVYRTLLSAGGGIGTVAELERFRRSH